MQDGVNRREALSVKVDCIERAMDEWIKQVMDASRESQHTRHFGRARSAADHPVRQTGMQWRRRPPITCRTLPVASSMTQRTVQDEWPYAVSLCTGRACYNQVEAALKSCSKFLQCKRCVWNPCTNGVFTGRTATQSTVTCIIACSLSATATSRGEGGRGIVVWLNSSGCPVV